MASGENFERLGEEELLRNELANIGQALEQLDAGSIIMGVTIGGLPTLEKPVHPWVNVQSPRISYPSQVVDGVRSALENRRREIEEELGSANL